MRGTIGSIWGLCGISLLLGGAIVRLGRIGLDTFTHELDWRHWTALAASVLLLALWEGYQGFQQRFSPRFAARLRTLRTHPSTVRTLLAPLYCMGFFHATRRRKIASYALTAGIVILVVLVRRLPQPWRGIVDIGVVGGLAWGLVTVYWQSFLALTRADYDVAPETPPPSRQ